MTRTKTVLVVIVTAVAGLVIGAAAAMSFAGAFISTAADSRFIADATIYLTTLEKVSDGDNDGATRVLRQQLNAAMLGLQSDLNRLSVAQRNQYLSIQKRAIRFGLGSEQAKPQS